MSLFKTQNQAHIFKDGFEMPQILHIEDFDVVLDVVHLHW
jgi:hypothetical protein